MRFTFDERLGPQETSTELAPLDVAALPQDSWTKDVFDRGATSLQTFASGRKWFVVATVGRAEDAVRLERAVKGRAVTVHCVYGIEQGAPQQAFMAALRKSLSADSMPDVWGVEKEEDARRVADDLAGLEASNPEHRFLRLPADGDWQALVDEALASETFDLSGQMGRLSTDA